LGRCKYRLHVFIIVWRREVGDDGTDVRFDSNQAIISIANHFNAGHQVASIQTTCHAGTHRSVAAAEIVAKGMRRRGMNVVVKHLHRRRGAGDPW
jgi:predicted protein tyrosine phosphatase